MLSRNCVENEEPDAAEELDNLGVRSSNHGRATGGAAAVGTAVSDADGAADAPVVLCVRLSQAAEPGP